MKQSSRTYSFISHLALFTVALIYGANYSIAKIVLDDNFIGPKGFILFRVLSGAVLISIVHTVWIREKIDRKDIFNLAVCGLFGVAINQLLFFIGLKESTPIHAALIMTTVPVLILILSVIARTERLLLSKVIGIGLGLSGTLYLITNGGNIDMSAGLFKGDVLILINAISYGLYIILAKKMMSKYHPITVVKWCFIFGLFFVLPFGWSEATTVNWELFNNRIWYAFIYVLLCTTFLAYILNAFALNRVEPTVAGTYIYFQPLLAAIIAIYLGKDAIDMVKLISTGLIFTGIYLVSFYKTSSN